MRARVPLGSAARLLSCSRVLCVEGGLDVLGVCLLYDWGGGFYDHPFGCLLGVSSLLYFHENKNESLTFWPEPGRG